MKSNEISPRGLAVSARTLHVAAYVVTALILWGTLWPNGQLPTPDFPLADKLWHMLAFAVWAGCIVAGWRLSAGTVVVGLTLAGAAIELIQPMTGRTAELADLASDLAGAALGVWGARWLLPRSRAWWQPQQPRLTDRQARAALQSGRDARIAVAPVQRPDGSRDARGLAAGRPAAGPTPTKEGDLRSGTL